jgi:hypothetical protein
MHAALRVFYAFQQLSGDFLMASSMQQAKDAGDAAGFRSALVGRSLTTRRETPYTIRRGKNYDWIESLFNVFSALPLNTILGSSAQADISRKSYGDLCLSKMKTRVGQRLSATP